ncbi:MAG: hypothetical protein GVX78_04760 [Bacteroidetes bacterium]|jgi:ssDNA-binding replication factor A large subunit|nr:hypothetical protein [Bacteroidota bacterium]
MKHDSTESELEMKIKDLEAKLEQEELKGRAYEIMIEIAKEKYNIDFEEQSGFEQFKNPKKTDPK